MRQEYNKTNIVLILITSFFVLATAAAWYLLETTHKKEKNTHSIKPTTHEMASTSSLQNGGDRKAATSTKQNEKGGQKTDLDKTSTKKSLPKEYNLAVPFTPQAPTADWGQPWQDACEEAGVLMLDAYYKNYDLSPIFAEDEIKKMVSWEENEKGWGDSIEIGKIADLAEYYTGRKARIIKNPTVNQIKRQIASGSPVLVVAYGKDIPNPYYSGDGPLYHVLIIKGYNQTEFITNDPGTKRGENFKYKYQDLMSVIHDWNDGDVKQGESRVLVLD